MLVIRGFWRYNVCRKRTPLRWKLVTGLVSTLLNTYIWTSTSHLPLVSLCPFVVANVPAPDASVGLNINFLYTFPCSIAGIILSQNTPLHFVQFSHAALTKIWQEWLVGGRSCPFVFAGCRSKRWCDESDLNIMKVMRYRPLRFCKAFYLFNHCLLLDTLQLYDLFEHIIIWMTAFLLDRTSQRVNIGKHYIFTIRSPQWSITRDPIWSTCFFVQINDLETPVHLYKYVNVNIWSMSDKRCFTSAKISWCCY